MITTIAPLPFLVSLVTIEYAGKSAFQPRELFFFDFNKLSNKYGYLTATKN
ncbi:hypothetical protein Pse7367_1193 [Thalassoporum mexicanum PCC 7367]|nr:hypothetical protein Pse7367_1193 [Pseudanabaena sp. PCC 7367]